MSELITLSESDYHTIYKLASEGLTQAQVAAQLDMSEATFARLLKRDPEAKRVYARACSLLTQRIAGSYLKRATGKGKEAMRASEFYLRTRAGWNETSVLQVQPIPAPIEVAANEDKETLECIEGDKELPE